MNVLLMLGQRPGESPIDVSHTSLPDIASGSAGAAELAEEWEGEEGKDASDAAHAAAAPPQELILCGSNARKDLSSRTKIQPKEEVFGTDIPRTSGGHSRGYPGPKLRSGPSKSWKDKHFAADIHDPKARTSTTLRDLQKLWSEKLWAEFSFSISG